MLTINPVPANSIPGKRLIFEEDRSLRQAHWTWVTTRPSPEAQFVARSSERSFPQSTSSRQMRTSAASDCSVMGIQRHTLNRHSEPIYSMQVHLSHYIVVRSWQNKMQLTASPRRVVELVPFGTCHPYRIGRSVRRHHDGPRRGKGLVERRVVGHIEHIPRR